MSSTTSSHRARSAAKQTTAQGKRRAKGSRGNAVNYESWWDPRLDFTANEWHEMVAAAASHRAEARGFLGDNPEDEWWEAEAHLREQVTKAEDEADEKSESATDLSDHDTGRDRDT